MRSYHTLVAWQIAHKITLETLRGLDAAYHPRSIELFRQIRKAAISIEANIVEGYALNTPGYLHKHYLIAFGSAAEAEILIQNAGELGYLPRELVDRLLALLDECMKALRGLVRKYEA